MRLEDRFCTLCGPQAEKAVKYPANFSNDDMNVEIFAARRMPDKRHFRLVECGRCGIIYSDPASDAGELARLYKDAAVTYDAQEAQIYESYAPVLERALARLSRRGTFLEIGGGRGFMLRFGAEHKFEEQIEIEPSADAERKFTPASPRSRFIRGIFTRGALPERSVSLACFFQMLDHVPNPGGFLRDVFEAVEPGGVAVCVTHDTAALSARLLGERSPIFDIEHTYLFNRRNLISLFEQAGFTDVEAFAMPNRYSLGYWAYLFPLPRPLKKAVLAVLKAVGLAEVRVNLYAGNCAVIGTRPKEKA